MLNRYYLEAYISTRQNNVRKLYYDLSLRTEIETF